MPERWQFRNGAESFKDVPAETVAAELAALRATGDVTPSRLTDRAADDDHPLHPLFEWDDAICGRQHRLWQARELIRSVIRVRVEPSKPPETVEMWIHVPTRPGSGREGTYDLGSAVVLNEDDYERALIEAQRDVDAAQRRFTELRRLAEGRGNAAEALAIAVQAFGTISEALSILRR